MPKCKPLKNYDRSPTIRSVPYYDLWLLYRYVESTEFTDLE